MSENSPNTTKNLHENQEVTVQFTPRSIFQRKLRSLKYHSADLLVEQLPQRRKR